MEPSLASLAYALPTTGAALAWAWTLRSLRRARNELDASRADHARTMHHQDTHGTLFRTLFDAAPECIKVQTVDGRLQRINTAGLTLLQTNDPARVIGQPVVSFIAPEYHDAYHRLSEVVCGGEPASMEFELITLHGRRCWLETHAVPLYGDEGRITGLLAVTRDIDERKRMTRELEEQRNRLHTIIESEPECVKLHDRDGRIMEMNKAGLALLNARHNDAVVGHSMYEFLCPAYRADYRALTENVFRGQRQCMEFEVMTSDGATRWLESHAAPLVSPDGQVTAVLAITRDIEERKRYERRLREQRDELAHVCRVSTLGELSSGLAHELTQPLCAISSYAQSAAALLECGTNGLHERLEPMLQKIVGETERANAIIQRLRDFVRRKAPRPASVDTRQLIADSLELVEAERRRKRVSIDVSLPHDLPDLWVDRIQIQQVLLNLLTNALQAIDEAPDAEHRIALSTTIQQDAVRVSLRDFAAGVRDDARQQLFVPFFTTKTSGLGMGLALSRSIAETHGGRLWYEPANPGSAFHLEVPMADRP